MKRQMPDPAGNSFGMAGGGPPMGGGGGQDGAKRYRNTDGYNEALAQGKYELRFLIPTKVSGAIIGRGGDYIKSIREKYDATLTLPDKSTPERVFTMIVLQERLADCFRDILSRLGEELEKYNNKKSTGEVEVRILVHQSHAGALIGRQGSKIKELREQTQSVLKVFQECCPMSTDRVLLVSAAQDKLPDVLNTLVEFMRDVPLKGVMKNYDASNYDAQMAYSYGGYIFEKPQHEMSVGSRGFGPPQRSGGYMQGPHGGDYDRAPPAYPQVPGPYHHGGAMPPPPHAANMYGGGRVAPPMPGPAPYGMGDAVGMSTTQVTIPNELGGTIIGKGGERINQIRSESGAKIDVGQAYGSNERIITITGTAHQIQTAQFLLQQTVRSSEAGRRYLHQQNVH